MKKFSILDLLNGCYNASGVATLKQQIVEGTGSEESATTESLSTRKELTPCGKLIVDIFTTIDAINTVNPDRNSKVIEDDKLEDYVLLDPLKSFIRPKRLIIGSETTGMKQKDALIEYDAICDEYHGRILTVKEFESAQFRLLRFFNPKCSSLIEVNPVRRETLALTEEIIAMYPVIINDELMATTKSTSIIPFSIGYQYYEEDEYVVRYTRHYVNDCLIEVWNQLVRTANKRCESN